MARLAKIRAAAKTIVHSGFVHASEVARRRAALVRIGTGSKVG